MRPTGVSVVIATRERWPVLRATLEALAAQRLGELEMEVVVADALSADGSWEELERYAAGAPLRMRILQAPAFGGAAARNAAIAAARCDLVLMLADDAQPATPTLVADHAAAHRDDDGWVALSGGLAWADEAARSPLAGPLLASGAVGDDRGCLGAPPSFSVENCSVSRAALEAVDGFDERLVGWNLEGVELAWRLREAGVDLERSDALLVCRARAPDAGRWLAELEDAGRHAALLDRLHPGRRTPGPRGLAGVLARAAYPLAARWPATTPAKWSALARGRGRAALADVPERRGGIRAAPPSRGRPPVAVVVPFHGDAGALRSLLAVLERLRTSPGDDVIVVDNTPLRVSRAQAAPPGITLLHASAEQSAPYARNAGAEATTAEWILFVDADCRPAPGLLDAYFAPPPPDGAGAVAGAVLDPVDQPGLAARYSASRERLGQAALLAHPYLPAAVTANLLVRRRTWQELGGLCEGIRSEEDLDFCWRMQRAGWTLEYRAGAAVEHRHRETVRGLLAQARRFGRGFAWQDRRYPGSRITGHLARRLPRLGATALWGLVTLRGERAVFALLDIAVAGSEVWGRLLGGIAVPSSDFGQADVVLVTDSYGDVVDAPVAAEARALLARGVAVRVEALRRGWRLDRGALHAGPAAFAEDDGSLPRAAAVARLILRRPVRCARHPVALPEHAPMAARVLSAGASRLHAADSGRAAQVAATLSALTGVTFSVHADGEHPVTPLD